MSKLQQFLLNNNVNEITEEVIISDRFKDENGELMKFKIKTVPAGEHANIQNVCSRVDKKGKLNFNSKLYSEEIITNYCLEPNFKDAEFIKGAGCTNSSQLINKVLLAGEITTLTEEILSLSGFNKDLDALREEAKN